MPEELPMEWSEIEKHVDAFYSKHSDPELVELKKEIFEMTKKIKDKSLMDSTRENLKSIGNDKQRLLKARDYIKGVVNG